MKNNMNWYNLKKKIKRMIVVFLPLLFLSNLSARNENSFFYENTKTLRTRKPTPIKTGNVIFIHPDGMSLSHWDAIRLVKSGLNKSLHLDLLPHMAIYRGSIRDQIVATSNAGGTIHAYGIKTGKNSFGMDKGKNILSKSGKPYSILIEAQKKGFQVALCQSGILVEPGTAAFIAQVKNRKTQKDDIAKQLIESNIDLLFAGGEKYLLPKGVKGHFGIGARKDNLNLIEQAKNNGYQVIYNLKNFKSVIKKSKQKKHEKILGIFAHDDTYNDEPLKFFFGTNKEPYNKNAPTIAEMTEKALKFLSKKNKPFFLVVEEEGTDNFSNINDTEGFFEAGIRADEAIGVARSFLKKTPQTLLIITSDSNAGGLLITSPKLTKSTFHSYPKNNQSLPFSILWPTHKDVHGGIIVKAEGINSEKVKGIIENTEIYNLMYMTLFGKNP